jgi:hypothetical protein
VGNSEPPPGAEGEATHQEEFLQKEADGAVVARESF